MRSVSDKNGPVIYQTTVEVEENNGGRKAKRAWAVFTPDRSKNQKLANLQFMMEKTADIQSDAHKSYSGLGYLILFVIFF